MPSEVGERGVGAGFMRFYSALSERHQKGQDIVCCLEAWKVWTERSRLQLRQHGGARENVSEHKLLLV